LSTALEKGVPLTIDLTHIAAIDTAGVQLLMGFQIAAAKRGTPLNFAGESVALTQALNVLGLRESFNTAGCRG
jgi:anti-anti-sigma regulatory factor